MQLKLEIQGLEKVQQQLRKLASTEIKNAASKALNDVAFGIRKTMQDEMKRVFDRPTPYIINSVRVTQATPEKLEATIKPTYMGGKGVDPQKILSAEVNGGARRDKKSEKLFRNAGILPGGYITVIPKNPFPGSDDGRGNLRGPFLAQLIAYFNAFGEQGFKANMKDKRRDKLANRGVSEHGYKTINGVVYFVSYGRLRSQHLAPGIWAKSGIHGSNVKPVLMFVKAASYKPRLRMEAILQREQWQQKFESRMRFRIRKTVEDMGLA